MATTSLSQLSVNLLQRHVGIFGEDEYAYLRVLSFLFFVPRNGYHWYHGALAEEFSGAADGPHALFSTTFNKNGLRLYSPIVQQESLVTFVPANVQTDYLLGLLNVLDVYLALPDKYLTIHDDDCYREQLVGAKANIYKRFYHLLEQYHFFKTPQYVLHRVQSVDWHKLNGLIHGEQALLLYTPTLLHQIHKLISSFVFVKERMSTYVLISAATDDWQLLREILSKVTLEDENDAVLKAILIAVFDDTVPDS